MRRILREFYYDLKTAGNHFLIVGCIQLLYCILVSVIHPRIILIDGSDQITLSALELLLPILGGHSSIMLMQSIYGEEGSELLFSYPRSSLYWGIIRQFRLFCLYAASVAIVCAHTAQTLHVAFADIFFVTIVQCFAVMGVSFFGVAVSKRIDIGLIVLVAFVGIQIILGKEYPSLNFIYCFSGLVATASEKSNIMYTGVVIGSAGWSIGQIWIKL